MTTQELLITFVSFITSSIAGMGWYIVYKDKKAEKARKEDAERHAKEREELMKVNQAMFDKLTDISEETNKATRETGNILTGLKTLLENQRHGR